MKITYIHQYFHTPSMSGGTRSYEMARRMVAAGHSVNMITSSTRPGDARPSGERWRRETIDGINVHWLPVVYDNRMGYARRMIAFGDFARHATGYARRLDADVVFATSTPLTIALPGVATARAQHAPMVFEVRDLWPELPIAMGALKLPLAKTAARRLERWAYANSERVVALSPGMADGVAQTGYPRDRIHCIPNSCDTEPFSAPAARGTAFRAERPWLGARPLVVYAGTFGKINGVGYLADLASQMLALDPEVRFLAIGAGAEVEGVRQRAENLGVLGRNFFMEPPVAKAEMPDVLSAATVCTSLFVPIEAMWNNSANKFFDALAAGRPVAINYGGWQAKLLLESGAGIVLDDNPSAHVAAALLSLLRNPLALASASGEATKLANSDFSRDRLAENLIGVLEQAVAERRG